MNQKNEPSLVRVRVTTHSAIDRVDEVQDGQLSVRVRAVAEKGRANEAVIEVLAKHFSIAKSRIEIVSGATSRNKLIRLQLSEGK